MSHLPHFICIKLPFCDVSSLAQELNESIKYIHLQHIHVKKQPCAVKTTINISTWAYLDIFFPFFESVN